MTRNARMIAVIFICVSTVMPDKGQNKWRRRTEVGDAGSDGGGGVW